MIIKKPSFVFRGFAVLANILLLFLSSCKPPSLPSATSTPTPVPAATPNSSPIPTPIPIIDRKRLEVSRLFNDMEVVSRVNAARGPETASQDRAHRGSYRLELTVHADIPAPSRTLEQITRNDITLPSALPGLEKLLVDVRISPAFEQIYALKLDYLKTRLARLDLLLDRHNFYDCETILHLENAANGRRALFLQGDMDVNVDGSDGDRNFVVDGSSMFFQPQTSYRWKRQTNRPNPFVATTKARIEEYKTEAATGISAARSRELRDAIAHEQATLFEMERYSFLIAGADPYVVLPGFMLREEKGPFTPAIGDYAVVVHNGVIYPAILGDAGPSYKFGEASVRLCKQLNPRSTTNSRPVSNLKVTYIVFPGSKDAVTGPPDLEKMRNRCTELLNSIGFAPTRIHVWENLIKPWPTPTPIPTIPVTIPTSTPNPTVIPSPSPPASTTPLAEMHGRF